MTKIYEAGGGHALVVVVVVVGGHGKVCTVPGRKTVSR